MPSVCVPVSLYDVTPELSSQINAERIELMPPKHAYVLFGAPNSLPEMKAGGDVKRPAEATLKCA